MTFAADHMRTFVGGSFSLEGPRTVADLRRELQAMDAELSRWGDDLRVASVWLDRDRQTIDVTLETGNAIDVDRGSADRLPRP